MILNMPQYSVMGNNDVVAVSIEQELSKRIKKSFPGFYNNQQNRQRNHVPMDVKKGL